MFKATFPLSSLLSLYFVVLSTYDGYASTFFTTSGTIEWILGGVQGIFKNHSEYDSACNKCDGKLTQLVIIEQGQGRCMWKEENVSGHPVLLVALWPVPGPVLALLSTSQVWQTPLRMHIYAGYYTGGVVLAWLPIYRQIVFKGVGSFAMWTSGKRVCVTELLPGRVQGSSADRLRAGSRARGRAAYTPTCSSGCTQTLFQIQRLWTGCSRGEALTCAGKTSCLRRATPSRKDGRGHLTHVRGATCRQYDTSESERLGTSCS